MAAKAEHLLALARAAIGSDRERALSLCKQIIAGERPQSGLRIRLECILKSQPRSAGQCDSPIWRIPKECEGLVEQRAPSLPLDDVLLPEGVAEGVGRFLAERRHVDALRAAGLSPSHRILLSGPPGNGKTTLAGAIADALGVPFVVMDYSRVISGYMGATGGGIAKVFRGLAAPQGLHPGEGLHPSEGLVLLVDEMETLLTERDRQNGDVGEIARVTSTLLLEIDRLPDHVVLIGATNHAEMLDRAVVRRFEHQWELPEPAWDAVGHWFDRFSQRYPSVPLMEHKGEVLQEWDAQDRCSLADIERSALAWCRAWVVREAGVHQGKPIVAPAGRQDEQTGGGPVLKTEPAP